MHLVSNELICIAMIWVAIISLLLGAGVSMVFMCVIVRVVKQRERMHSQSDIAVLEERLAHNDGRVRQLEGDLQVELERSRRYALKQTELQTRLEEERKASEQKQTLLEATEKKLLDTFKVLSSDALRANNQEFLRLAKENLSKYNEGAKGDLEKRQQAIERMVLPIREGLNKVDEKINSLEKVRVGAYASMGEQIQQLLKSSAGLQSETANLTKALRAPQVRGRWGEMQLRRTVELAGMIDHCDFTEQVSVQGDEQLQRPDMLIQLPNDRVIVVDAKVPIAAYLEAVESDDPDETIRHLKDHARQVRDHLKKLGSKAYWKQFESSPEFVVLFLPGEAFFSAALQSDTALIEYGIDNQTILATPTTLIALLKAVAYGWQQESIAKEAKAISQLGLELYERVGVIAGHFTDLRKGLDRATTAYNRAVTSMETRFLPTARRLQEMNSVSTKPMETLQSANSSLSLPSAAELVSSDDKEQDDDKPDDGDSVTIGADRN